MATYLMGIDAGTTGCKTCIFDLDGNLMGMDYREYPCYYPNPGWVEQIPEDITPALFASCKAAIENSKVDPKEIKALAISTQGSVFGPLDENDDLLRPFIGWQDTRGVDYIEQVQQGKYPISAQRYYEIACYPIATVPCATKYMWMRDEEPQLWEKTVKISHHQDFFLKEFGADDWFVNDVSTASRAGIFDVETGQWSEEILQGLGISGKQLPRIVDSGTVVGKINAEIAKATGLAEGTVLCVGAHDQNCSTMGGGLVHNGTAVAVIGTYGAIFVASDFVRDPNQILIVKGNAGWTNYTAEAASIASASCYRWFRDTIAGVEVAAAKDVGINAYELLNREIEDAGPGAGGLTFLPYMQGAASGPRADPYARGAFLGMTLGTTKGQMARAVMEGITLEMRDNLEAIRKMGIEVTEIRAAGGATNSDMWCQMQADMYKCRVVSLETPETGCLGAALYAGVGVGVYRDLDEAVERAVRVKSVFEPNPENYPVYDKAYEQFVCGYEALAQGGYFRKIHEDR